MEPVPNPSNIIVQGGHSSLEDLVRSTKRAVLVTRCWYIRSVDPKTILLAGLSRDGTFWIEHGTTAYPIKNFRWNESSVTMLKNMELLGKPVRVGRNPVPALKVKEFTYSSLSDAVRISATET